MYTWACGLRSLHTVLIRMFDIEDLLKVNQKGGEIATKWQNIILDRLYSRSERIRNRSNFGSSDIIRAELVVNKITRGPLCCFPG